MALAQVTLIPQVLCQMPRIKDLKLHFSSTHNSDLEMMRRGVDVDAPLLETLALYFGWSSEDGHAAEEENAEEYGPLHHLFTPERSSRLHTVSIVGYYGWTKWSLRNLRHLYLLGQNRNATYLLRLRDILSDNNQLESLVLH